MLEKSSVHELALMDDLVREVASEMGAQRVRLVRLEVGQQAAVLPEALRFCFDVCVEGTTLEGAVLDIVTTGGAELRLKELEVD